MSTAITLAPPTATVLPSSRATDHRMAPAIDRPTDNWLFAVIFFFYASFGLLGYIAAAGFN